MPAQPWCPRRPAHQVPVDEAAALQVLHARAHVLAHAEQRVGAERPLPGAQVVQQAAVLHELGHDVQRPVLDAHAVQLHQPRVRQPPARDTQCAFGGVGAPRGASTISA